MTLQERINDLFKRFNINLSATELSDEIEVNLEAQAVLENGTIIYTDADSFDEGADVFIVNEEGERIPLPQGEYTLQDGNKMSIADGGKVRVAPNKGEGKDGKDGAEAKDGGDAKAKARPANPAKSKDIVKDGGDAPAKPAKPAKPAPKPNPPKKGKKSSHLSDENKEINMENVETKVELNEEQVLAMLQERFPDLGEEVSIAIASAVAEIYSVDEDVEEVEAKDEEKEEMYSEESEEKVEELSEVSEDNSESVIAELKSQLEAQANELTELKSQAAAEGVKRVNTPETKTVEVELNSLNTEERIKALYNQFNKA